MATYYESSFPKTDKQLEQLFLELVDNIGKSTPVDLSETHAAKIKRIKKLEADPELWFEYYFPEYCFAKSATFQKASTSRIMAVQHMIYQCRAWARGLSKSTRRMMEVFYLAFVKKHHVNCLLCSKSEDNAARLLAPYKANFEANQRLINDYGKQKNVGNWTDTEFITQAGYGFRAVGAAQNPRGSKIGPRRINTILADDLDDDEVCRNTDRLDHVWEWWQEAVIPTIEIANPYYIFVDNNIIAEDSIQVRAMEYATDKEIINITDDKGVSTWPEKNTPEVIDRLLKGETGKGLQSYASQQKEYYNNPMANGKTFTEQKWGICPPLNELSFIVCYTDPSSSNKDKPTLKSGAGNSRKAVVLMGRKGQDYYIYKSYLAIMGSQKMIECMYDARDFVNGKTIFFSFIENNSLQDPIYSQIYLRLINEKGTSHPRGVLGITPDRRDKGEKWTRIEANLEPINRLGHLIFNIEEMNDPGMIALAAEFKAAKATSKHLDGCDAVEGAKFKIDEHQITNNADAVGYRTRERSNSKYC